MIKLYAYVQKTWFGSSVWKPRDICAYRRLVRTNNDAEGYHTRLNGMCGAKPPVYNLLKVLYREAQLVSIDCQLITSKLVTMQRRKKTKDLDIHVQDLWDKFDEGLIDARELLYHCRIVNKY